MFKSIVSLLLFSLFVQIGYTQITHVDYGDGLYIEMNENYSMDINDDGTVDFYINEYNNELGFTPIKAAGCFTSDYKNDLTPWGAYELSVHEIGESLSISEANMEDYIDEGRAGIFSEANGLARDWNHDEEQYIGFAVLVKEGLMNGWMRVKLDLDINAVVVLEYAYEDIQDYFEGGIKVGDTGEQSVNVNDLEGVLDAVIISPNPVQDLFQIRYTYTSKERLQINILDNLGKTIQTKYALGGQSSHTFDTSDWTTGTYFISLSTSKGVKTERVFVSK